MVVVVGAGITGAATAYYLSRAGVSPVTVIDSVGIATCSKAAAFLSESWGDRTKTEKLHRTSFRLHLDLAEELGLKSFRQIPTYHKTDLECDDENLWSSHAKEGRHALVDPKELVSALMDAAQERGTSMEIQTLSGLEMEGSTATGICFQDGGKRDLDEEEAIVLCIGPWASRLEDWIGTPMPIDGVLSTSLVWQDLCLWDDPKAMFCEEDMNGCHLEMFQRVDKSIYVSGLGNSKPLKASYFRGKDRPFPGEEVPSRCDAALRSLQAFSAINRPPDDIRACVRPQSPDGVPVVGKMGGSSNVYVASGGGQWGITWGPLLGLMVTNMICEKDPPLSPMSAYSPARFDTLVQRTIMNGRSKEAWP
ncbi:FAD dependent oxidoreductase [Seminavis robusta]|uniref:FAD dependent oxidoreductase n=1 Tax=Seminavis robusta TaxID=568900 RepID=A0A9N8F1F8_9STRA|nr:FAD dependent oxidoreductase [Seminavis robusta]|eukprot:Sro2517_g330030.1 FAD dependent oxidoreductase (364) ;mRNA; f:9628-10719